MHLDQVLSALHAEDCREAIAPDWQAAMAALPAEGPPFLRAERVREFCEWCSLEERKQTELQQVAKRIDAHEALRQFAWYCYWRLFLADTDREPGAWPSLEPELGSRCGAFYKLVGLAMVEPLRRYHESLGVPEDVTRETCLQIECYSGNWERAHDGQIGMYIQQLQWLRSYVRRPFLRLGRFEYECSHTRRGVVQAFRHRKTGEVVALAGDNIRFNVQGFVAREHLDADAPGSWTSTFALDEKEAVGCVVSPFGMATQDRVRLPLDEWECVLQDGAPVLSMHIPAGGKMGLDACVASMQRAARFFPEHFPEFGARVIECSSWLFNTDLEQILKPEANLVQYQRELYLYPVLSSGQDGLWFIFLQDAFDPATVPRDTSLRRSIAEFIQAGNVWRGGGMFVLFDDVDRLGTQPYRRQWPPDGLGLRRFR